MIVTGGRVCNDSFLVLQSGNIKSKGNQDGSTRVDSDNSEIGETAPKLSPSMNMKISNLKAPSALRANHFGGVIKFEGMFIV